ncbi:Lipopolysaccharide export system ATP-binding protein LptB [Pseudodesulfovibrio hydrargyri]|uniref:Lipopolysaccharide export system ATP-binding protein LptB n=1 Tax=Pseudodesulfovibrio hydrargyri TaxID=2125990 RepID=A0A1J5N049_9BACT|nr:urea ABC transporter ATP-binding protein UrtD [Pseudodesulfovibrio hydrargyri]OIQ49027.1 Lipopolysaccharide export system ATP-binding protein LptB [Pseudodesulfovibrio hydrargyri]
MKTQRTQTEGNKMPPVNVSQGIILHVNDVTVSFDGFKALNKLSMAIDDGSLHCIIGPNGAGKTTMLDIITGKTRPDEGTVFFGSDLELTRLSEPEVARAGVGRKFQTPTVFERLTLFENLELALKADKGLLSSLFWKLSGEQKERIEEVLEIIGARNVAHMEAGLLSHGQKQWLEIGMLLMQSPRLLLLDEPAAGMTPQELENSIRLLNSLKGEHTVVVIEHDMEFVRAIAERVTVLHEGSVLAEGSMDFVQNDPKVVEVYLGE